MSKESGTGLTPAVRALLDAPNYAVVATVSPTDLLHTSVVWIDTDGEHVLLNTLEGRQKLANLRRDPRATVTVVEEGNWYRWASIHGRAVEMTQEGARQHLHALSRKYEGHDFPYLKPEHVRWKILIRPERVVTYGLED